MLLLLQVLVLQATAKIQNTGVHSVAPENIYTPTMEGFLIWTPHPSGNSILVSYFHSKN